MMGNRKRRDCIAPDAGGVAVSGGPGVRGFGGRSSVNVNVTVVTVSIMFVNLMLLCLSFGTMNGMTIELNGGGTVGTANVASGARTGRGGLNDRANRRATTVTVTLRRCLGSTRSIRSVVLAVGGIGHACSP